MRNKRENAIQIIITFDKGQQNDSDVILYGSTGTRHHKHAHRVEQISKTILPDGRTEYRNHYGELIKLELPEGIEDQEHVLLGPCTAYLQNNQLHREDGPAVIQRDGFQVHYQHGQLHREDGPAVIRPDGHKEFWKHGVRYSSLKVLQSYR